MPKWSSLINISTCIVIYLDYLWSLEIISKLAFSVLLFILMFDFGYAMSINVPLQCAYLWYWNNNYDNDAYFSHLLSNDYFIHIEHSGKRKFKTCSTRWKRYFKILQWKWDHSCSYSDLAMTLIQSEDRSKTMLFCQPTISNINMQYECPNSDSSPQLGFYFIS